MKSIRHIDPDKITFGTYYQSLLLCQRDPNEPNALQSDRKGNYISDVEEIENRRNQEEAKDWQENNFQDSNTAFRRGSEAEEAFDDIFDK